jgi:hypothetical protein
MLNSPLFVEPASLDFLREFQHMPDTIRRDMWTLRYGHRVVYVPENGPGLYFIAMLKYSGLFHWQYEHTFMETQFKLKEAS